MQNTDATQAEPERLSYSIPEVVELSGLSRSDLYRALGRKELVARKRGKRTLILADELKRFLTTLPTATFTPPKGERAAA